MFRCYTIGFICSQIASKDATISSLQATASKLQEDYAAQLQRSQCHAESGSGRDRELSDDDLSLVRPWTSASNCVPYEAMGTLKMSSLTAFPTGMINMHVYMYMYILRVLFCMKKKLGQGIWITKKTVYVKSISLWLELT